MINKRLVSVCIPCCNAEKTITETLKNIIFLFVMKMQKIFQIKLRRRC